MRNLFLFLFVFATLNLIAQNPKLIKNLASTVTEPNSVKQEDWWTNQWRGMFFYQGKGSPSKLCVTDGTSDGTRYIADIGTGAIADILPAKDFVYITTSIIVSASPFTFRYEIYKTDGTAAGTSLVFSTSTAPGVTNGSNFCSDQNTTQNFCLDGTTNKLYFNSYDATNGNELWVTDGTTAGTFMVKDIKPGVSGSFPWGFIKIGNDVYFNATAVGLERKLWKTDGTEAGTVMVNVPEPFFIVNGNVNKVGNKMIFFADNTVDGYEPYISDGTPSGTFMLANINPSGNALLSVVQELNLRSNGKYSFMVLNNGVDTALYRTDGTPAGTIRLSPNGTSFYHGVSSGGYSDIDESGLWFIQFNTSGSGNAEKIFKSDGTSAGTYQVAQNISYGKYAKIYKNALWMQARDIGSVANTEPWRSGGNPSTTNKAIEIAPGLAPFVNIPYSSDPNNFFVTNNKLYFFAKSSTGNAGLYEYNGDFTFNGSLAGGNWKDSANWNSMMPPGITDTVFINSGTPNAITINGSKAYTGVLQLGNNALVTLTNATDSLFINNKLISNSTNSFTGNGFVVAKNSGADTVQLTNSFTASNLLIQSSSNLQAGTINISNQLTLSNNSKLILNNNNLVLTGNTSAATGSTTSYIVTNGTGKMSVENIGAGARTNSVLFPVGTTAAYNPVSFTNAGTSDVFGVRVSTGISTSYSGETPGTLLTSGAVNNTWFITEATAGGTDAAITLQWNGGDELPGFDRNQTFLGHYTGGAWSVGSAGAASGSNTYTYSRSGISSLSPFGLINNIATPVTNYLANTIKLNVYPNPVRDILQFSITEQMQKEELQLQMMNSAGQTVLQRKLPKVLSSIITIDVNTLPQGSYYLLLKGKTIHASAYIIKR